MAQRPVVNTNLNCVCPDCGSDHVVEIIGAVTTETITDGVPTKTTDEYHQRVCLECDCDKIGKAILSKESFATRKNSKLVKSWTHFISTAGNKVCAFCGNKNVNEIHLVSVNVNTQQTTSDDLVDHYCDDCDDYTKLVWS